MIQHFFSLFAAMDILEISTRLMTFFVPFLFALCFHEYAHGWVARLRGDRTAEMAGRLTMNPLAHADPIGTFLLPILSIAMHSPLSFGWAKPVPVNSRNLKNPRTDMFWVALAGPLSNIFLAIVGSFILVLCVMFLRTSTYFEGILTLVKAFIGVNLFLAFFNLIPIHPLDGGKIIAPFLPERWNRALEDHQMISSFVLLALLLTGAVHVLEIPVEWTYRLFVNAAMGVLS